LTLPRSFVVGQSRGHGKLLVLQPCISRAFLDNRSATETVDDMQIQFLDEGERLIAQPEGRLEANDSADFVSAIEARLQPAVKSVTIDLEKTHFVNFGGIRALLRLARSLNDRKVTLDFARGNPTVREALDLAGLDDLFPFNPPFSNRGSRNDIRTP
jgi:anti-anti-sigma factor